MPLNGASGHPNKATDLTVCQIQGAVQNQNALLCLRQSGEGLGHKLVINEARAYLRNMKRQREREAFFSDLSQAELDKLCVVDRSSRNSRSALVRCR